MDNLLLLKGMMIGFSIAAPVGPIGVLCIKRTLSGGLLAGLTTGLGAAAADFVYGSIAGLGLTAVSGVLLEYQLPIRIIGGIFLCYLAYVTFTSKEQHELPADDVQFYFKAFLTTFFLTVTNPMTILAFIGIFAGVGIVTSGHNLAASFFLVIGVFAGSLLWWMILSAMVNGLRTKFDQQRLLFVNKCSGIILGAFGCYSILGWLASWL